MKFFNPSIFKAIDCEARSLHLWVRETDDPVLENSYQLYTVIVRHQNIWVCEEWKILSYDECEVDNEIESAILDLFFDHIDDNLVWRGEPILAPTHIPTDTSDSE